MDIMILIETTKPHSVGCAEGYRLHQGSPVIHGNEFERRYIVFCEVNKLNKTDVESMEKYYYSLKPAERSEVIK